MNEGETETEHDRKVRDYWKKFSIYDLDFTKNDDKDRLPYEPTAVLAKTPTRKFSIYDISSLNFTT